MATLDDYDVVREHLTQPIGRGLGVELTAGAARLLEYVEAEYDPSDKFTAHDLMEGMGLGKVVYDRMGELRHHGYIKVTEPGSGNVAAKWGRNPYPTEATCLELPDLKKNDVREFNRKTDANVEVHS